MASAIKKYNFDGKVALVTGSSYGIGEAIAIQLAQYGALVTITARSVERLARVESEIEKISGRKPLKIVGDLKKDLDLPRRLISQTVATFGQLDILVNNAAGFSWTDDSLLSEKVMQTYDELFQVNVRAALDLTRLAVPHLEKTKGNIVNISAFCSIEPFVPIYSMSKATIDMLTKTAAQELGVKGIRVNSVNPGIVDSGAMTQEEVTEYTSSYNLLDRIALPVDVANLVSFLASSDAANITGSCMVTDSGCLIRKKA